MEYVQGVAMVSHLRYAVEDAGYSVEGVVVDDGEVAHGAHETASLRRRMVYSLASAATIMLLSAVEAVSDLAPFRLEYLLLVLATRCNSGPPARYTPPPVGAQAPDQQHAHANRHRHLDGVSLQPGRPRLSRRRHLPGSRRGDLFRYLAAIIGLVLLGRYLELRARGKASDAIAALAALQPGTAKVMRDNREIEVAIDDLAVGDLVVVRPGERLPVDGEVLDGVSFVDESMLTGESCRWRRGRGMGSLAPR